MKSLIAATITPENPTWIQTVAAFEVALYGHAYYAPPHPDVYEDAWYTAVCEVAYWAMGDIHKHQTLNGMPHARYPGPPCQHKFNELPDKGVLLVDTKRPKRPEFVRLTHPDVAPLVEVEADEVSAVKKALESAPEGSWVNLRVPGDVKAALHAEDTAEARVVKSTPSPRQQKQAAAEVTERIAVRARDPLSGLGEWLVANRGYTAKKAAKAEKLSRSL